MTSLARWFSMGASSASSASLGLSSARENAFQRSHGATNEENIASRNVFDATKALDDEATTADDFSRRAPRGARTNAKRQRSPSATIHGRRCESCLPDSRPHLHSSPRARRDVVLNRTPPDFIRPFTDAHRSLRDRRGRRPPGPRTARAAPSALALLMVAMFPANRLCRSADCLHRGCGPLSAA